MVLHEVALFVVHVYTHIYIYIYRERERARERERETHTYIYIYIYIIYPYIYIYPYPQKWSGVAYLRDSLLIPGYHLWEKRDGSRGGWKNSTEGPTIISVLDNIKSLARRGGGLLVEGLLRKKT